MMSTEVGKIASHEVHIDDAIEQIGNGLFQRRILWAAGLAFASDSMEILLMSLLSIVLQSHWQLEEHHTATIVSAVFLGALLGTLVLGPLGDRIGRKPVFRATAALIAFFGFLTALSNGFVMLLLCRFMVGFGVGGLTVPFDTLAEFVPGSARGTDLLAIEYFWTGGTILVPILAYVSLGNESMDDGTDWRFFVTLCAIPCVVACVFGVIYVPESPRWLVSQGRHDEALGIIREAAKTNGLDAYQIFPEGIQLIDHDAVEEGTFADLLKPKWFRTTITLWATWLGFAFAYYGTIIVVTMVFSANGDEFVADDDAVGQYSFDYTAIFTSAVSEIFGTTIVILMIDRLGRIPSQVITYVCGGISMFAFCYLAAQGGGSSRSSLVVTSFLARMFFMGGACTTWVSTAEILSTEVRTTGHAASNAIARLGGSIVPYILTNLGFEAIGLAMLIVSLLTALSSSKLPETRGQRMGEIEMELETPKPQNETNDQYHAI